MAQEEELGIDHISGYAEEDWAAYVKDPKAHPTVIHEMARISKDIKDSGFTEKPFYFLSRCLLLPFFKPSELNNVASCEDTLAEKWISISSELDSAMSKGHKDTAQKILEDNFILATYSAMVLQMEHAYLNWRDHGEDFVPFRRFRDELAADLKLDMKEISRIELQLYPDLAHIIEEPTNPKGISITFASSLRSISWKTFTSSSRNAKRSKFKKDKN